MKGRKKSVLVVGQHTKQVSALLDMPRVTTVKNEDT